MTEPARPPAPARAPKTGDARMIRSGEALERAMLDLLERKALDQITVRDIVAEAGIHYATFFRHHATKEALLDRVAADEIRHLVDLTLPMMDDAGDATAFRGLCQYVSDHRRLWTALLTGGAAATMRTELLNVAMGVAAQRVSEEGWIPVELAVLCTTGLIIETVAWWLRQPEDAVSVEHLSQILYRLVSAMSVTPD